MNVNVLPEARDHFWQEPEEGSTEFWAFRFKPPCEVGDELIFRFDKKPVARAIVDRIEKPGESACDTTGMFRNKWKVYWLPDSFEDLRCEGF